MDHERLSLYRNDPAHMFCIPQTSNHLPWHYHTSRVGMCYHTHLLLWFGLWHDHIFQADIGLRSPLIRLTLVGHFPTFQKGRVYVLRHPCNSTLRYTACN